MKKTQNGSVLIPFIIVMPVLILIAGYAMDLAVSSYRLAKKDQSHTQAQFATDAGIDYALQQINTDVDWTGTASEVELMNDGQVKSTYQITVDSPDPDTKTITAIGRAYRPVTTATPESTVKILVNLRPVSSGDFSIVSGAGGLVMKNSSKIVAGDILINGTVTMSNTAQIGLTTNPVNISVADQACPYPPDATYPQVCGSGPDPISIGNSAHIYGTVKANNQSSGSGMSDPGLTAGTITPQPLPTYDRDAQKAAVAATITGSSAGCSNGTKTWAANTKITGSVTVSGSCKVTVEGNVWITGDMNLQNSAQLIVSNSLGSTVPVIMVDGSTGATFRNGSELKSNSSETGFEVITYWSDSSCSPDCASLSGTDLYDSRDTTTISLQQTSSAPQTIFYAYWSQVDVGNSGQIGALVGQTISMNNTGTITFGTSVPTDAPSFWVIDSYRRVFD